jgi:transposase
VGRSPPGWKAHDATLQRGAEAAAVRTVRAPRGESGTEQGTVTRVARELGYGAEPVRSWARHADIDDGQAPGLTTVESVRVKELEQEV